MAMGDQTRLRWEMCPKHYVLSPAVERATILRSVWRGRYHLLTSLRRTLSQRQPAPPPVTTPTVTRQSTRTPQCKYSLENKQVCMNAKPMHISTNQVTSVPNSLERGLVRMLHHNIIASSRTYSNSGERREHQSRLIEFFELLPSGCKC